MLCGKTIFVFSSNTCISWSFLQLVTWAATVWNGDSWWVCCPVLWDDSSWLYLSCLLITLTFNFSHHFYPILYTFRWGPLCWNPCTGTSTVSSARENPEETEQLLQLTVNAPLELLFCKMIVFVFFLFIGYTVCTFKIINWYYCFSPVTHLSKLAVSGRSMTAPHWLRSGVNSNQERRVPMTAVLSVCLSQSILNSIWRKQDMENPTTTPFSKLHMTLHNTSHLYKNILCWWCKLCISSASCWVNWVVTSHTEIKTFECMKFLF